MISSRLYYDIKELSEGVLKFYYFTDEINENADDLKSYTKTINQKEVLSTLHKIGIKNLLYNINEVEYFRLLIEIEKYKDDINNLSLTVPSAANTEIAKLCGPNKLQRKFIDWFTNNGYPIADKYDFINNEQLISNNFLLNQIK